MRRSFGRTGSAFILGVAVAGSTSLTAALAQDAGPLMLGQPRAVAPQAAAPRLAEPAATPALAKPAAKPKAAAAATPAVRPADPKKAAKASKPPTAKPQVDASAARAAKLAAMTGQATPPQHRHVFETPKPGACANPNAIGVSRVMKVDTHGGFYVGTTYHTRLPLEPKEVVLTFDDGPMAVRTDRVLKALDEECTKATFFIVGQMAKAYPETLRKTAAAGHTIAYHTMTHPLNMVKWPLAKAQDNVREGWQTVDQIVYGQAGDKPATPFFRYPGLFNSRALNEWFNGLDMGVWTIDAAGNDWLRGHLTIADGPNVMNEALKEIEARQGGILLLHDIKDSSSSIVGPLLKELHARGYKIVHVVPMTPPPKLATGPVKAEMPTVASTAAPLPERSVDNFDAARQLAQQNAGRTGKTSAAPLPSYDGRAALISPLPAPVAPPAAAIPPKAEPQPATSSDPETTGSIAPRATKEDGWFSSTASSFRGFGGALGLW